MIANNVALVVHTRGKGTYEITQEIENFVRKCAVKIGTVTVFVKHTSASLVIMENADPSARRDLEEYNGKEHGHLGCVQQFSEEN